MKNMDWLTLSRPATSMDADLLRPLATSPSVAGEYVVRFYLSIFTCFLVIDIQ
jgi:hypothetical protein